MSTKPGQLQFANEEFAEHGKGIFWLLERSPSEQRAAANHILDKTSNDKRKGIKVLRRIVEETVKPK